MKTTTPIVVKEVFNARVEEVWKALKEHHLMVKWYFENIPEFKAIVGFKAQFNLESNGRDFFHMREVTSAIPNRKIGYRWEHANYAGEGHVLFELSESGDKTVLKLTATGIESFHQHISEFKRESCQAG